MRYHTNIKTILISLVITLLFFVSSVIILIELNLTSPTLIVTNRILSSLSSSDSDISFKFDSVERNFRDKVSLRGFSLYYKGEETAAFDTIEIKLGLFDIISYFLNLEGSVEIAFRSGDVMINESLFSTTGNGTEKDSREPSGNGISKIESFLSTHNITLSFNDVVLSFPYGKTDLDSLRISYIGKEGKIVGDASFDTLLLSYEGYSLSLNELSLSFIYGETLYIKGDITNTVLNKDSLEGGIENTSFSLSIPSLTGLKIKDIVGACILENVSIGFGDTKALIKRIGLSLGNDIVKAALENTRLISGEISAEVDSINGELKSLDEYTLDVNRVDFSYENSSGTISPSLISGSLENEKLSLDFGKIEADTSALTGNLVLSSSVDNFTLDFSYNNGLKLNSAFAAELLTGNSLIEPVSFESIISLNIKDGKLYDSSCDIKNIYLGWGEKYDSLLEIKGDVESMDITLSYGEFSLDVDLSLKEKKMNGNFTVENFALEKILPLLNMEDGTLFDEESLLSLESSFNMELDENNKPLGRLDYSFSLPSLNLYLLKTLLSSSGTLVFEEKRIDLENIVLDTSFFSLKTDGYWDIEKKLPTLDFTSTLSSGSGLIDGYIHLNDDRSYTYYGLFTCFEKTSLSGLVDFNTENLIVSSSLLVTDGRKRPFTLQVDLLEKTVSILSGELDFNLDYSSGIKGRIKAENLETLSERGNDSALTVDGELDFSYTLDKGFGISSSPVTISNLFFLPSSPSISLILNGEDGKYDISSISITGSDGTVYSGRSSLDLKENTLTMTLGEKNGSGSILFSLYKEDDLTALFKGDDISLEAIGMDDMILSFNLFGRAQEIEDFSFNGKLSVSKENSSERKMNAEITLNSSSLYIDNIIYSSDSLSAEIEELYYDAKSGSFGLDGVVLTLFNEKPERAYPIKAAFSLEGETKESTSLYSSISSLIKEKGIGTNVHLALEYIDGDSGLFRAEDRYADFTLLSSSLVFSGDFISGYYSFESKKAELNVNLPSLAVAVFKVDLSNEFEATASISEFNMGIVNLLLKYPTLVFRDDLVGGEVSLTRKNGEYSMNGSLFTEELGCDVFWIEDQTLIFHNARFIIWDNELSSSFTYVTVYDHLTGERKMVRMSVGVSMNETLSLESWDVEVYIDDDNPVRVRLPLTAVGADILAYVTGHYHAYSDDRMQNEGVLNLSDTVLSIGMNPYPEWYNELTGGADMDLRLNFRKNNTIVYPAGSDPIFTITLQENSFITGFMDKNSFNFTGDVQIRGGEIYYFQKYFYITSGSISFDDPSSFNPRISLRATLRDYDSSSEKVEIYLVMKDNTFDNLSPTLESSPTKELSEIMEILGQSILPQSAYGSVSATSVASLVTEGFDILSRLGIVTTGTNPLSSLSTSLKNVFGVDSFSLHSNILNNIVADTISQATSSTVTQYSPMARFLNGTTLNIGKYLSQNLYLQIMVHLEATKSGTVYTIISDDLALDTEFSIEWVNDAFNISFFTKPSYFSFYSILSTFGFSITKIINF